MEIIDNTLLDQEWEDVMVHITGEAHQAFFVKFDRLFNGYFQQKIENQPFPGQTTNLGSYKNKSVSDLKEERTLSHSWTNWFMLPL